MEISSHKRAPLMLGVVGVTVVAAAAIGYHKLRSTVPEHVEASGDSEEVGDMRYTLVCDACAGTFELSAADFAQQFSAAAKAGRGIKCLRCGAERAHLKTIAEERTPVDLPPDVKDNPEKIIQLVQEKYARIAEINTQFADRNLKRDPERNRQLQAEFERLHYEADALAKRWMQLVGPGKALESGPRPHPPGRESRADE